MYSYSESKPLVDKTSPEGRRRREPDKANIKLIVIRIVPDVQAPSYPSLRK